MGSVRLSVAGAIGLFLAVSLASSLAATETITYTYDTQGQVVAVDRSGTVNDGLSVDISYDAAGNRTNYTSTIPSTTADIAISDAVVTEGGNLVFTVMRSGATSIAASASYATLDGTATAGSDYTGASGTVSFAAGETSKTITVATIDDSSVEAPETMTVTLSGPSGGATVAVASGTGTINDNDSAQLSIGDASVTEGGTLSFTVTRGGNTAIAASASYTSASGTATSGSDFTAVSGTVSFAASETSKTITVATADDSTVESAETMTVTLSSPSSGTTITTATGTGTINDNETATVTLSINNRGATEGKRAGTIRSLTFTVTKTGFTTSTVTVHWATVDGTAIAGSDYVAASGTLSFSLLEFTKDIELDMIDDSVSEAPETMTVVLDSPTGGAGIGTGTGTGTIVDDD